MIPISNITTLLFCNRLRVSLSYLTTYVITAAYFVHSQRSGLGLLVVFQGTTTWQKEEIKKKKRGKRRAAARIRVVKIFPQRHITSDPRDEGCSGLGSLGQSFFFFFAISDLICIPRTGVEWTLSVWAVGAGETGRSDTGWDSSLVWDLG